MTHDIKSLHLELSKRCLLACTKCPRTRNKGQYVIDDLDINHAITSISTMNPAIVNLCGNYGDPLYYPKLLELTQWMHKNNYAFELHTNGSGKKISWWEEYYSSYENIKYGKRHKQSIVIFGIDGLEDTAHNYRVGINWKEAFDAMCLGAKLDRNVIWQWIPFSFNEHQIDDAKKIAEDNGITFMLRLSDRWHPKDGQPDPLMPSSKYLGIEHHGK